ncbi:sensor histidine kinase [Bailinhaonella thermotolerans]|uniref:histidine kinase n=1 Tax=Bailinhaonella thermotolerans TaxID=1070861 RepID=A0A3A4ARX8_9ACTN|nr:sensor histidine kinase [Bailinhaonella thermotolerans]RJL31931.1 sensor histidine kinase [Bailinhaonella thermotolerans]
MHGLLRSVWDEPRPPSPPGPGWRDWALVGTLVPVTVLEGVLRPDLPWRAVSTVVAVGLVPTLLWRRSRPLLLVAICFGVSALAQWLIGQPLEMYSLVYLLLLPYSLFRWGSGRETVAGLGIIVAAIGLSAAYRGTTPSDLVGSAAVVCASFALGWAFRYRAKARTRELDQIKLLEREQLARELHDTVAHHVSAMAIRAQAGLATAATRPDAATEALRLIEAEAARALDEMRAMVRVLRRNEPADLAPGRGVADLAGLASRGRAGPAVEVEVPDGLDGLPPQVGAAIYRIAQEAVTNARRHARHATRIEVRVTADDDSVRVRVRDDGETASAVTPGYGLLGMIERAGLLGGSCTAGPDPERGWTVTAVLPRAGAAA